jgi:acetyl esterase/lipase
MDEQLSHLLLKFPVDKPPDVPFTQLVMPLPENRKITIIIYMPNLSAFANLAEMPLSTVFFVPGMEADEDKFTSKICQYLCTPALCQVIFINLRWVEPQSDDNDAYEAMKFFITTSRYRQSIDKDRIVMAGSGSGNRIAASMAVQALKDNIPILGQVLLSSNFYSLCFSEMSENNIPEKEIELFLNNLSCNKNSGSTALPSFWSKEAESKKLPPTTILLTKYDSFGNYSNAIAGTHRHPDLLHKAEVIRKLADDILRPMFENISGSQSSNHKLVYIQPAPVINDALRPKL